ncbi:MAG TPA: S1C family serine protease [Candidatus Kryptonia bacterium]|nr:S1C family serine protease [Candidatus Kryptonia bacterium]
MNASIALLEKVLPTTAHLHATVPAEHPSIPILGTERAGSGTVVDSAGLILTAHYIVLGADRVEVTLLDGSEVSGEVAARDFVTGLALVKIDATRLPAVKLAPSTAVERGDEVFVVASAGASNRRVSNGVVMALESFDAYWEYSLDRAITATATNPGLGGGALCDRLGRMVGVASLELNEIGRATLAIPVEFFLDHRDELMRHGRRVSRPPRAWIGLYCYNLRDRLVVAGVLPGTPGEQAGLQPGDILLSIDGEQVHARRALYRRVWAHRPGDAIECTVFRNDRVRSLTIQAGDAEVFFR